MGRSAPSEDARAAITTLESRGAKVTVAAADVSERSQLEAVLKAIPEEAPLGGVVHSALVLQDGVLTEQTADRFTRVMAPKVAGAWNLHELTKDRPLDFFVLFSSLAALVGNPGQCNYAAANTFLDALAQERHAQGMVALSIAWGAWSGGGAVTRLDEANRRRLEQSALTPQDGLALFERALAQRRPHVGAFRFDATLFRATLADGKIPPFFRALVTALSRKREAASDLVAQLRKLEQGQREAYLQAALQAEAAKVLALTSANDASPDRPLRELGLDSIMAVELRNRLSKRIGRLLPATLAFDHPSIERQARYILERVLGLAEAASVAKPVSAGASELSIDDISKLSQDAAIARLKQELGVLPGDLL
jgi:epothilone polyketide synthase D